MPAAAPRRRLLVVIGIAAVLVAAGLGAFAILRARGSAADIVPSPTPVIDGVFTRLPETPGHKRRLSVFPDGRHLLWAGDADGDQDVYVQQIASGHVANLTTDSAEQDFSPTISPDGETLAFVSLRQPPGLYLMPASGGVARKIMVAIEGAPTSWSPDGRFLLVSSKAGFDVSGPTGSYGRLSIVSVEDGRSILQPGRDAGDPSWSPDGRRILFLSGAGGHSDIWTMTSQGSAPARMTDDKADEWSPRYSPDGRYLYYGSDRSGSIALWRMPIDEGSGRPIGPAVQVTRAVFAAPFDIAVARDGRTLFLLGYSNQETLHALNFDPRTQSVTGSQAWIARDLFRAGSADISPDGRRLVVSLRTMDSSQEDLVTVRTDGSGRFILTEGPARDESPRWSPDASRIAFQSDRGGRMEIWTIRADGSDLTRVASAPTGDAITPVWSPDGSRLAFAARGGDAFIVPLKDGRPSGDPQSLPKPDLAGSSFEPSSWSPDGREIAGTAEGIAIYSPAERRFRRLTESGREPIWLPGGRWLLFTDRSSIHVLDARTGERHEVFEATPNGVSPHLSVAPDGRTVYVSLKASDETIFKLSLRPGPVPDQGVR